MLLDWQATARASTLESQLKSASERHANLEGELSASHAARERLEGLWRQASGRARELEAQLATCAAERAQANERLAALPEALRTLEARMRDTLLTPIEETLRTELAPPAVSAAAAEQSAEEGETRPY